MRKRIEVIAGGGVVIAAGILFTAYQVQQEMMPGWLFKLIVVGGPVVLVTSLTTWLFVRVILPALDVRKHYGFRWPLRDKTSPDPNQWLLNIAAHDAENPQGELRLLDQRVVKWATDPKIRRPWIELGFTYFNGGVHTVLIGPAAGRPKYRSDELPDPVESSGRSRVARGASTPYVVRVVLPCDVAEAIYQKELVLEVARSKSIVRSLSLSGVTLQVESEPTDGNEPQFRCIRLGDSDTFIVGAED